MYSLFEWRIILKCKARPLFTSKVLNRGTIISTGIHDVRPHKGQKMVARRLRSLLHSDTNRSEIAGKFLEKLMMYAFKLTCLGQFNRDACF